jgi:hypothetical protein
VLLYNHRALSCYRRILASWRRQGDTSNNNNNNNNNIPSHKPGIKIRDNERESCMLRDVAI